MKIKFAHSPDADDAFMFYGIEKKRTDTYGFEIEGILSDIETLNQKALDSKIYEATAVSFHVYPYITKDYYLMKTGASIGYKYGPVIISNKEIDIETSKKKDKKFILGNPGKWTTANLILKIFEKEKNINFQDKFMSFDKIIDALKNNEIDAGLIIHEGQITYKDQNLIKVTDLGEWWFEKTNLPIPLGCNVVKKSLGKGIGRKISEILKESILYAKKNKEEAIAYASKFARGISKVEVEKFVDMYVNERTIELGDEDIEGIKVLLKEGYDKGIIPFKVGLYTL